MSNKQEQQLQSQVDDFKKIQADYSKAVQNRTTLESQLKENRMVLQELQLLKKEDKVFKAIGPCLVPNDKSEAEANVKKRIEYINGEIKRLEITIKELDGKQDKKREEIMKLQQTMQQMQVNA